MPVQTTYPGVYIQELPSGQHTIAPVATSITAFIGRAPIGPTDEPMTINSFGDYQRFYGGLSHNYPLGFAVRDFFQNGGSQAVIARLFEPNNAGDSGVALLPFPASPPMLPEGWLLKTAAAPGSTTLSVWGPADSEGEPVEGMQFTVGSDTLNVYTVTGYTEATAKAPAQVTIVPPYAGKGCAVCCPLTFEHGPDPQGWSIQSASGSSFTLQNGSGLPELGDMITLANAPVGTPSYQITDITSTTGQTAQTLQMKVSVSPKPKVLPIGGTAVTITPPQQAVGPTGWQVLDATVKGNAGTLTVANGVGTPLTNSVFAIPLISGTMFQVTAFTPATSKSPTTIAFTPIQGDTMPDPSVFATCFCAPIEFQDTPPTGYTIKAGPKAAGDTQMTVGGTNVQGALDVGYTFQISGGAQVDDTVYTIRIIDQSSGAITFLPGAKEAFSSSNAITFSPPLQLVAANPGSWGNHLTATVDTKGITAKSAKSFAQFDLEEEDLFNLTLTLKNAANQVVATERYLNCSVKTEGAAATYGGLLSKVLASQSNLARQNGSAMVPPTDGAEAAGSGGDDGTYLSVTTYLGDQDLKTGIYMLEHVQQFDLLCIPPDGRILPSVPSNYWDLDTSVLLEAAEYSTDRRAMFIVDPPSSWANMVRQGEASNIDPSSLGITGMNAAGIEIERNAAVYFPRVVMEDITSKNQLGVFPACGIIAGIMAATDVSRGVWKAPAGIDAGLAGVTKLEVPISEAIDGTLNPLGINCLRTFPVIGSVVWGARTLRGADAFEDDYKYVPVRRLTLFVEDSLVEGTRWAVFEPNDEALWSSLRLSVESFLAGLARQGAFYDYKVTCDASTTTPDDIALGKVNILVQIAPVDPAEFVVIEIQQIAPSASS